MAQLPWSSAEATATPLPEPPSKVLPIALMAVGGAAIIAGGVVGLQGLNDDANLKGELTGTQLQPMSHYQQEGAQAGTLKTIALVTLIAGAAVAVVGIILYPRGPGSGAQVALVPSGNGAALAGSF